MARCSRDGGRRDRPWLLARPGCCKKWRVSDRVHWPIEVGDGAVVIALASLATRLRKKMGFRIEFNGAIEVRRWAVVIRPWLLWQATVAVKKKNGEFRIEFNGALNRRWRD